MANTNEYDPHQLLILRDGELDNEYLDILVAQERSEALKTIAADMVRYSLRKTAYAASVAGRLLIDNIDEMLVGKREVE